jgi:hypothetical protein
MIKVRIEYGCNCGRGDSSIDKTETVECESLYELFCSLKRKYLKMHDCGGDPNNSAEDYLNEFSECSEEFGEFYIGFEEGDYIGGWRLI